MSSGSLSLTAGWTSTTLYFLNRFLSCSLFSSIIWITLQTKRRPYYTYVCMMVLQSSFRVKHLFSYGSHTRPFNIQDGVGLIVDNMDQHVSLSIIHPALLVHVELNKCKEAKMSYIWCHIHKWKTTKQKQPNGLTCISSKLTIAPVMFDSRLMKSSWFSRTRSGISLKTILTLWSSRRM